VIDGHVVELSVQRARILELALRPGGLPFAEAREAFGWQEASPSEIRARVEKLKGALEKATRQAPIRIRVTTVGERITATVQPK